MDNVGLQIGDGSFFVLENQYVFGGQSKGFTTKYQNVKDQTYDSYLFKYNPNDTDDCLNTPSLSIPELMSSSQKFKNSEVQNKTTQNRNLFEQIDNIFAYTSRFCGAFDLLNTFRYPKMCAKESFNLEGSVEYSRG